MYEPRDILHWIVNTKLQKKVVGEISKYNFQCNTEILNPSLLEISQGVTFKQFFEKC